MSKKKLFKIDGSEDFDGEALEPEETDAATESTPSEGIIGEAADDSKKSDGVAAPSEAPSGSEATPSTDAEKKLDVPSDASTVAESGSPLPSVEASTTESTPSAEPEAESPPKLTGILPDMSSVEDAISTEVVDHLRDAGNALTPALTKLQKFEAEIAALGDEAKARFSFARAKAAEAVGAFERLFKRG